MHHMKNDTIITPFKNTPAITQLSSPSSTPEYANHHTATALFGFSRSSLYALANAGSIRSVNIRKPGSIKGKRLFDCASIRAFLNSVSINS